MLSSYYIFIYYVFIFAPSLEFTYLNNKFSGGEKKYKLCYAYVKLCKAPPKFV